VSLLVEIVNAPSKIHHLKIKDWELLVRQARGTQLLSYLADILKNNELYQSVPKQARNHFDAAVTFSIKQSINVKQECDNISKALNEIGIKTIYLKGAAYSLKKLPLSNHRLLSDIDVLVEKKYLRKSEEQLFKNGWFAETLSDYDDSYYRKWSHEIPPLKHVQRKTVLDLHHNILPITTINSDINQQILIEHVEAIDTSNQSFVFSPALMVLHSAAHLFYESEFEKGLRDLIDIKELVETFSVENDNFYQEIQIKAKELGLERTLFYAFRYVTSILNTKIENKLNASISAPTMPVLSLMDFCFNNVLIPNHSSCHDWKYNIAKFILYWRGHLLRMPLNLLLPHLARKSYMRIKDLFCKNENSSTPIN